MLADIVHERLKYGQILTDVVFIIVYRLSHVPLFADIALELVLPCVFSLFLDDTEPDQSLIKLSVELISDLHW